MSTVSNKSTLFINLPSNTVLVEGVSSGDEYFQDDYFQDDYFQGLRLLISANTDVSTISLNSERTTVMLNG